MGTDGDEDKGIIENGFSQMQGKWNLLETNTVTKALSLVYDIICNTRVGSFKNIKQSPTTTMSEVCCKVGTVN